MPQIPVKSFIILLFVIGLLATPLIFSSQIWFYANFGFYTDRQSKYKLVYEKIEELVEQKDPGIALQRLKETVNADPSLASICHGIAHETGHAAVHKYNDLAKALSFRTSVCGNGYLHGTIEEYVSMFSNKEELTAILPTICEPDDGSCSHGIGHGIMQVYENEVVSSLLECNILPSQTGIINCYDGVFMEMYETGPLHGKSIEIDDDIPFSFCRDYKQQYKYSCYFYAARYPIIINATSPDNYREACIEYAEDDLRKDCFRGLGSAVMKTTISDPYKAAGYCGTDMNEDTAGCLNGMISYYIVHYDNETIAPELCNKIPVEYKAQCMTEAEKYAVMGVSTQIRP